MQPDDRVRLLHMVEAAETAAAFVAGRARADLDTDRMLLFAVVRAIEVVGEAANHVSDAGRALLPGLPWPAIVGMRNVGNLEVPSMQSRAIWSRTPVLAKRSITTET